MREREREKERDRERGRERECVFTTSDEYKKRSIPNRLFYLKKIVFIFPTQAHFVQMLKIRNKIINQSSVPSNVTPNKVIWTNFFIGAAFQEKTMQYNPTFGKYKSDEFFCSFKKKFKILTS